MKDRRVLFNAGVSLLLVLFCVLPAVAAEVPKDLPAPDRRSGDRSKPVKIYIMLGQTNMVGYGQIGPAETNGTLQFITRTENKFAYLLDAAGDWHTRKDVWCVQVTTGDKKGWLTPGFGSDKEMIGPELGFGNVMGYVHDAPVMLVKSAASDKSLGWDFLPPSSRTIPKDQHPDPFYQGWQYDICVNDIRKVLTDLPRYFPAYRDQGYEVAGFVWWQGHKDQSTPKNINDNWSESYEENLVNLITDLRKEFKTPQAPFVLATIAFGGTGLSGSGLTIARAQMAVDGSKGAYPEFRGNVKTVDARPFWRDANQSPSNVGSRYNQNAETYVLVGEALGRAMAEMIEE